MKPCICCKQVKALDDFYTHQMMRDGRLNKCKECCKAQEHNRRVRFPERISACEAKRFKTMERKAQMAACAKRRRELYPEKYVAWSAVSNAIRDGRLERGPCEVCGTVQKVQAHHHDYHQPLNVRWLCFKHHREVAHGQRVVRY